MRIGTSPRSPRFGAGFCFVNTNKIIGLLSSLCLFAAFNSNFGQSVFLQAVTESRSLRLVLTDGNPHVHETLFVPPPFTLRMDDGKSTSSASSGNVTLAADVFLTAGCIKFVSVITCDFPQMNFSKIQLTIHQTWKGDVTTGAPHSLTSLPTRVLHRDGYNWEPVTVGEYCFPALADVSRADVTLSYTSAARRTAERRYVLERVASTRNASPFAMMTMFRNDSWLSPAWLDIWTALGVGHFYIYYNGALDAMRAENGAMSAALESDERVTLQAWDYPMRTVIVDTTGTSKLPIVNKYGHVKCYLHYAKMMAFNDAYHKFGARHEFMGFFDLDEYLGVDDRFLTAALRMRVSPLSLLAGTYGAESRVLQFLNRWSFISPPVPEGAPLHFSDFASRQVWGGDFGDFGSRTKFFVRTAQAALGGLARSEAPFMIGNHYTCTLAHSDVILNASVLQFSGLCKQPVEPEVKLIPGREAYSMHLINFKPHVSLLGIDEHAMFRDAVANNSGVDTIAFLTRHWRQMAANTRAFSGSSTLAD